MIWFLTLHIAALLIWCATLLYLPPLIAGNYSGAMTVDREWQHHNSIARFMFTHVATPAALLAIIAGTIVFLINRTIESWLIAKLTLVTGLVIGHTLTGVLILRVERAGDGWLAWRCWLLEIVMAILMLLIIWIVLDKPEHGALL